MIGDCFRFIHRLEPRKGLLKCVETGHEVVAGHKEAYARNKRCRPGLIDHALSHGKSPLTMFSQCLISRLAKELNLSRVQAYWGYYEQERGTYGKRFLHRLEQVERGDGTSGKTEKIQVTNKHKRVKEETDSNDSEFWMLMSSSGSESESEQESDEKNCKGSHCDAKEYEELSERQRHYDHEAQGYYSVFEEHMSSVTEKSAKYAQIAAEEEKLAERSYAVASKITDNSLYHFCVFSDNIVATSVVVNSTALNSKAPEKVVFHLVTNDINYAATKSWFTMNMDNLRGVTVDVQNFEDFKWLNASYVPVLKQLQD
uniref:Hexosyltransferase n=1 Tax=Brassica campestris TaxID=3711 RepID=M4DES0_BRACM